MDYQQERDEMVARQIAGRGVRDPRVLQALREVPRERFLDRALVERAYEDGPLGIGYGQTISQPFIVALMCEALGVKGEERALEVGTGSGYGAAVLGRLVREVHTVERNEELAFRARERLQALGATNVHVVHGDGSLGLPALAPFEAIAVTAAGPRVPPALPDQLAVGGRLVVPVGRHFEKQRLVLIWRTRNGFEERDLGAVAFVPLIGEGGWPSDKPPG